MEQYFPVLRNCPLFKAIPHEDLPGLIQCLGGRLAHFRKNETIFSEGDCARFFGIVCSGEVQVVRVDYYGNRTIVGHVEAPNLFGEAFACAETETLPVSVVASEDSEILLLDCRRITNPCGKGCGFHHKVIFNLLKIVAMKNILFNQRAEIISKRTTREKLLAYLMFRAKEQESNQFTIPFDRQELADYLEVDRSGLSAEISKLRKEGILHCRKNQFELL